MRLLLCGIIGVMVLSITGCVGAGLQLRPEEVQELQAMPKKLREAKRNSAVKCPDKATCDKAFSHTKIFIQNFSDMKIQLADETLITTYNPRELMNISIDATKTPDVGDSSIISIDVKCRENGMPIVSHHCGKKSLVIYDMYKTNMTTNMKK